MKILIRGAGDLATGIASRLYGAGHQILMTEIAVPLTVRRTVALSRAVYEGSAQVEEMKGVLVKDQAGAEQVMENGDIAVMVDEKAVCREWFRPDVIVDAILAKKNLGTKITDAPFVIGVGPGFTAGVDCNCVVETKRGHTLGNIIWRGAAIPNTGVPGNVAGYTIERLIRAEAAGILESKAKIGDYVEKSSVVAVTGGVPVYAQMTGIVRGMLQPGVQVNTISDKARAIGGGVLEAVTGFERMKDEFAIVILAAGAGTRFGGNKLNALVRNKPLYEHTLERVEAFSAFPAYIVTGSEEIAREAEQKDIATVWNKEPERGIALSLTLGLKKALEDRPGLKGILFTVCDQPGLDTSTMQQIFRTTSRHPGSIVCAGSGERTGNPVCWDRTFFPELLTLEGDEGGRQIMRKYREKVRIVQADPEELKDIDRREDLI